MNTEGAMQKTLWMYVGLVLVVGLLAPEALAEDLLSPPSSSTWVAEGRYHDALDPSFVKPVVKLGRGLGNVVGGPLEIPVTIQKLTASTRDPLTGLFTGLILGAFKAVIRTGTGIYEAVTFLIPCPDDYAPILPPLAFPDASSS